MSHYIGPTPGYITFNYANTFGTFVGSEVAGATRRQQYTAPRDETPLDLVPGTLRGYRQWRPSTCRNWIDSVDEVKRLINSPEEVTDTREVKEYSLESLSAAFIWNEAQARAACYRRYANCATEGCVPTGVYGTPTGPYVNAYTYGLWECPHHVPPVRECTCGLYATHRPEWYGGNVPGTVVGVVNAWGKIELGTAGFRAQHARIVGLSVIEFDGHGTSFAHIRSGLTHYGVPVFRDPGEMIEALPPVSVDNLLDNGTVIEPDKTPPMRARGTVPPLTADDVRRAFTTSLKWYME